MENVIFILVMTFLCIAVIGVALMVHAIIHAKELPQDMDIFDL